MKVSLGRSDLSLLGVGLLTTALTINYNTFPGTFSDLSLALVVCATAAVVLAVRAEPRAASYAMSCVALVTFSLNSLDLILLDKMPLSLPFLMLGAAIMTAVTARRGNRVLHVGAIGLLSAVAVADVALPWTWGRVGNDVFTYLQSGAGDLLKGHNPYVATYPTMFATTKGFLYMGSAHITYLPIILLIDLPARLLGDIRLTSALAMLTTGACIYLLHRRSVDDGGRQRSMMLAILIALPLASFMITYAWVDTEMMAAFVLWLLIREKHARLGTIFLALAIGIKVTALILLVPYLLWLPRVRRETAAALALVGSVVAPFVVWTGPTSFYEAVAGGQLGTTPRPDALGITSLLIHHGLRPLPGLVFGVVLIALVLGAARFRPKYNSDLLAMAAAASLVVFLFAKLAYLNYYFDTAVCLLATCALGSETIEERVSLPLERSHPRTQGAAG